MKPLVIVTCLAVLAYVGYEAFGPDDITQLETRVYQCRDQMASLTNSEQERCWAILDRYREARIDQR